MEHLLPFYLFFCLIVGLVAIVALILARRASGWKPLDWLIVFYVSMGVSILSNIYLMYRSINLGVSISRVSYLLILAITPFSTFQYIAPSLFLGRFFELPHSRRHSIFLAALGLANLALAASPLSIQYAIESGSIIFGPGMTASQLVNIGFILYALWLGVRHRRSPKDAGSIRLLRLFLILTLLFLPGFLHDLLYFSGTNSIDRIPPTVIYFPLYFCALSGIAAYRALLWLANRRLGAELERAGTARTVDEAARAAAWFASRGLSLREAEIAPLVAEGLGNKQIAGRLGISAKTVNNHLYSVYQKFGINSRYELLALLSAAERRESSAPSEGESR